MTTIIEYFIVMNGPTEIFRTTSRKEANLHKSQYTTIVPVIDYGQDLRRPKYIWVGK